MVEDVSYGQESWQLRIYELLKYKLGEMIRKIGVYKVIITEA